MLRMFSENYRMRSKRIWCEFQDGGDSDAEYLPWLKE